MLLFAFAKPCLLDCRNLDQRWLVAGACRFQQLGAFEDNIEGGDISFCLLVIVWGPGYCAFQRSLPGSVSAGQWRVKKTNNLKCFGIWSAAASHQARAVPPCPHTRPDLGVADTAQGSDILACHSLQGGTSKGDSAGCTRRI